MDYWDQIDPIWDKISIYEDATTFLRQFSDAPRTARMLFAAHWCQSEICNGGFDQFFSNSTGILAPEAIDAFMDMGMPQTAELIRCAMALFGPFYPRERNAREAAMEQLYLEFGDQDEAGPFAKFDPPFFALIEQENGGFEVVADAYASRSC